MIYKKGFSYSFNESACARCKGKCCIGESGYIFINTDEITALSKYLNLSQAEFKARFLEKIGARYSLKETPFEGGFACVFFDQEKRACQIYKHRPSQCRSFPFWEYFNDHKKELQKECPGICF